MAGRDRSVPEAARSVPTASQRAALARLTARLAEGGASLAIRGAGLEPIAVGASPPRATVVFRDARGLQALERSDHLALAEAYLYGSIDVEGDLMEVVRVTDHLTLDADPWSRLRLALTLLLRNRERYDAESIAAHYDRPADFFTPWLDRWRCYSHGLYDSPDDSLEVAIERKMQRAVDALGLEPGMEVLDMGGGWGCFVEYAGLRGIRVQAITISREQHAFVQRLIDEKGLPCSVELVNFRRYRPERPFDGAVFMGTFEHNPEYRRAARWLAHHLKPGARVWADFCAQRSDFTIGRFMKRYIWPGPITYVSPQRLVDALLREGFNVHELADDTLSYACTVRDWGDRMEAHRATLEEGHGAATVRAFLLFLRGSLHFLRTNRTQAYHVVAGREPAPLPRRAGGSLATGPAR